MNCYLLQLPKELWIKILGQLPVQDLLKSAIVCRKWNQFVFDGALWTTIDVTQFYKTIPIELILKLIKSSGQFLRIANFRGCIQLTGHALRTLAVQCPYIQVLIIKDCRGISTASINYFLQHAVYLKILDVSGLDTIKASTLSHHTFRLNQLQRLDLSWCRNLTGAGVLQMVQSCQHLTHLKLNGCPQLDSSAMAFLGRNLSYLIYLNLAACTSLTDAGILSLFENHQAPHLTHLTLSSCARLTDQSLRAISIYATQLTHLELSGCVLLSDQGLHFLLLRLRLIYLDLEDLQQLTGATLTSIAHHQTQLEHLCLSNCIQISDDDVIQLVLQGVSKRLCHLELDNCTISDRVLLAMADYLALENQKRPAAQKRQIRVEVLDCSSVTETGIKKALAKADSSLSIKSFFSFLDSDGNREDEENLSRSVNHLYRLHRTFDPHTTYQNSHPQTRPLEPHTMVIPTTQPPSSCIIL